MAREVYVYRNGKVVPKSEAAPLSFVTGIVSDTIDLTWHPANGKYYDSKSEFRRVTQAHGCIEVGNDRIEARQHFDRPSKSDVYEAVQKVRQGYRPALHGE